MQLSSAQCAFALRAPQRVWAQSGTSRHREICSEGRAGKGDHSGEGRARSKFMDIGSGEIFWRRCFTYALSTVADVISHNCSSCGRSKTCRAQRSTAFTVLNSRNVASTTRPSLLLLLCQRCFSFRPSIDGGNIWGTACRMNNRHFEH